MEPFLFEGDIVFMKKYKLNKTNIKSGDIIIFKHPTRNINLIKRVKDIQEYGIAVSGDNKKNSDDSNLFGLIPKESIKGIMTSHFSYKTINKLKDYLINKK